MLLSLYAFHVFKNYFKQSIYPSFKYLDNLKYPLFDFWNHCLRDTGRTQQKKIVEILFQSFPYERGYFGLTKYLKEG